MLAVTHQKLNFSPTKENQPTLTNPCVRILTNTHQKFQCSLFISKVSIPGVHLLALWKAQTICNFWYFGLCHGIGASLQQCKHACAAAHLVNVQICTAAHLHNCAIWQLCTVRLCWCVDCRRAFANAGQMCNCKCASASIHCEICPSTDIMCAPCLAWKQLGVASDLEFAARKLFSNCFSPSHQEMLRRAASSKCFWTVFRFF